MVTARSGVVMIEAHLALGVLDRFLHQGPPRGGLHELLERRGVCPFDGRPWGSPMR